MSGTSREKICIISSQDKDDGSISNSNFRVTLRERYSVQSVDRISIIESIVPNAFYNISDGSTEGGNGPENNNLILEQKVGAPLSITISAGQYNVIQFIAALQASINLVLVGDSVVITRNDITNLLTFTFLVGTYTFSSLSSMAHVIGFIDSITTGPLVYTMTYPPDLSGINSVYIHSEALSDGSGIDSSKGIINLVDSISLHNIPYGTFAYKQTTDASLSTISYTMPRNLNVIDIRLRDREGKILNIGTKKLTLVIKMYYSV